MSAVAVFGLSCSAENCLISTLLGSMYIAKFCNCRRRLSRSSVPEWSMDATIGLKVWIDASKAPAKATAMKIMRLPPLIRWLLLIEEACDGIVMFAAAAIILLTPYTTYSSSSRVLNSTWRALCRNQEVIQMLQVPGARTSRGESSKDDALLLPPPPSSLLLARHHHHSPSTTHRFQNMPKQPAWDYQRRSSSARIKTTTPL